MEEVVERETEMVLCDPTAVMCLLWGADSFCCSLSRCLDLLAAINRWSPLNIPWVWLFSGVQSGASWGSARIFTGSPVVPFLVMPLTLLGPHQWWDRSCNLHSCHVNIERWAGRQWVRAQINVEAWLWVYVCIHSFNQVNSRRQSEGFWISMIWWNDNSQTSKEWGKDRCHRDRLGGDHTTQDSYT